jgi:hypothetical protein
MTHGICEYGSSPRSATVNDPMTRSASRSLVRGFAFAAVAMLTSNCSSSSSHVGGGACSEDGSDAIAAGTYVGGSLSSPNQTVVLLPGPSCGFCWDLYSQDGQDVSGGTTWSSAWAPDHRSIVISINPALSSTSISVSPNGAMLSLTDEITGTPAGFNGDTMPLATCDGASAAKK